MNPPTNLAEFAKTLMPPGMKFCPTDQEMIVNYLYQKITGRLTSFQTEIVRDCDLYGDDEPWQIWEQNKGSTVVDMEQNLYFFTRLKTKNTTGKRILRRVGKSEGTWHGEDAGSKITCSVVIGGEEVCLLGYKKRFNYRNPKSDQHGLWIMHEYSLACTDYVVCRMKYSKSTVVSPPSPLPPPPPPSIATGVSEMRPWISLACGSGDDISSTCGEASKQGGKNGQFSGQIEVEKAKKGNPEKIEQKNEKSVSAAEAKNDESTESDGRKKLNVDNENTAYAPEKPGLETEGSNSVERNDLDDGETTSEKTEIAFPIVGSPVLESSDGKRNGQKKGVAASAQAKNDLDKERGSSDFEKNDQKKVVAASPQAKNDLDKERGSSDFEKNVQAKGKKIYEKAKSGQEMNDFQRKGKATSVNALMDRLFKKDELVTNPLPKTGRGHGKRQRVELECTGEDESTSNKGKKPQGSMDILIEALGLNK